MSNRLPQNYIPKNYELYLHIVQGLNYVDASITIMFQKNNNNDDKVYLNIGESITIKKIVQDDINLNYQINYPKLIIIKNSKQEIEDQPITIYYSIHLEINPKEKKGFYIYDEMYLTHLKPVNARNFFPCFDEPCIRSIFSIKLLIPISLTAISNMPIKTIELKEEEQGKIIEFYQTPSICSYLICVFIGNFSYIEGITENGKPVKYYTKNGNEKHFQRDLETAIFSMNWMEKKFNVKYELPQLQLISLEGCPAGMENYGLITLPDYSHYTNYIQNITVIMHEVIHQWFGNLVSIKYWDSLWLKEGFA